MQKEMIDILWVAICSILVFLMQAGFLCLEAGLCRSKNYINIAVKNVLDMGITVLIFWSVGFALMFGASNGGWYGISDFFRHNNGGDLWGSVFFVFQAMFCGTAVTILSGAVAERMKLGPYLIMAAMISAIIYPVFGHWAWGGLETGEAVGWLEKLGFVDFAGSTVVHSVGGWVALAAVLAIGPRLGRFPKDGPPQEIPGANIPLAAAGVMILWFGWFGFNGGSALAFNTVVPKVITNTLLGASAGMVASVLWSLINRPHINVADAFNGVLAGAVGVTANCHAVTAPEAVIIGAGGGLAALFGTHLLERLRIDDAVGAIPVHLFGGLWGTFAVALFADPEYLNGRTVTHQMGLQLLGMAACALWSFGSAFLVFKSISLYRSLRVDEADEKIGLNISEHGARTEILDFLMVMEEQQKTGDLSLRAPVEPFTEVGHIAGRYNSLMESLQRSIALTDAIVRTSLDGIVTISKDTLSIQSVNPAAAAIFGVTAREVLREPVTTLLKLSDEQDKNNDVGVTGLLLHLAESREKPEYLARRADGTTVPVQLVVTETDAAGEDFYTATIRDITERRRTNASLRTTRDYSEALLDSINEGVVIINQDLRILTLNRAAADILESSLGNLLNEAAHTALFPAEMQQQILYALRRLVADPNDNTLRRPVESTMLTGAGVGTPVSLLLHRFQTDEQVTLMILFRPAREAEQAGV